MPDEVGKIVQLTDKREVEYRDDHVIRLKKRTPEDAAAYMSVKLARLMQEIEVLKKKLAHAETCLGHYREHCRRVHGEALDEGAWDE